MQSWADWLDLRLGYRCFRDGLRRRILPNRPGWGNTSASCLLWLLVIQCVTGLLLMATYSPSMSSAWASVHFIDQSTAGRFLRGVHHYTSHAMIIIACVHVIRVLLTGIYRAPRELVWITGLLLFPLIIVWTVTGNPLSASQKGIAQIQVEGNILGSIPFIGPFIQRLLFGGDEIGNLTLTRLYSLHVGFLPLIVGGLCCFHLHQVLKHSSYRCAKDGQLEQPLVQPDLRAQAVLGSTSSKSEQPTTDFAVVSGGVPYWPYQSVRNVFVLTIVVAVISGCAWTYGAPLYAPADPELAFSPRPEWYFRWLFELRRHFTGKTEYVATLLIPSAFLIALMATPFLDRFQSARLSSISRMIVVLVCIAGWGWLTLSSYRQDWQDADFQAEQARFESISRRALDLARTQPISAEGAVSLLKNDPETQGPRLFSRHCLSCHSRSAVQTRIELTVHNPGDHSLPDGHFTAPGTQFERSDLLAAEPSAPNLYGLGTTEWIRGFLEPERIVSDDYFGLTKFRDGDMVQHVQSHYSDKSPEQSSATYHEIEAIAAALAAEAGLEETDSTVVKRGRTAIKTSGGCTDCHRFHDQGELGTAPDLTGYGSAEWLKAMIAKPDDPRFYADRNDRMPAFASDAMHAELNLLSAQELDLLVQWLRRPTGSGNAQPQSSRITTANSSSVRTSGETHPQYTSATP